MKKIALFLVLAVLCASEVEAQKKPRRRLSYSELFAEIQKHPDSTYRLENAEIYYNHQTDSLRFGTWVIASTKQNYNPFGFKEKIENGEKFFSYSSFYQRTRYTVGSYDILANYMIKNEKLHQYLDSLLPVLTIDKFIDFRDVIWEKAPFSSEIAIKRIKFKKQLFFHFTNEKIFEKERFVEFISRNSKDYLYGLKYECMPDFQKCEFIAISS